tara:strand:- start:3159 stop:3407 length:249 start_codon:yes stop_codon:yes gene_type:complete
MVHKSKTGGYHKGNRNNYIFAVSCLLSEYGVPEEHGVGLLSAKYPSLEYKELKNTINSAYRKTKHSFGSKNGAGNSQGGMFN